MSVAEKPITETPTRSTSTSLALQSLVGGALVLFGLWILLAGLPLAWAIIFPTQEAVQRGASGIVINEFLRAALLFIATMGAIVGLGYLARQMERANDTRGLREGAIIGAIFLYIIARLTIGVGNLLADREAFGMIITAAVGGGLLFLLYLWFSMPGFTAWLGRVNDSGWFRGHVFKGNQGVKMRRFTVIAILIIGFWGIYALMSSRLLGVDRPNNPNDWYLDIPFTGTVDNPNTLPMMFRVHIIMPILLAAALLWLSWRVVNIPTFTDFLIATEAEMNKVSWTSRKNLIRDTIVVLVTIVVFTVFLFLIDILWIQILSSPYVEVLQVNTREAKQKLEEKAQW